MALANLAGRRIKMLLVGALAASTVVLVSSGAGPVAADPPLVTPSYTNLGALPGATVSFATAVNSSG